MIYYYNILEVPKLGITDADDILISGIHYDVEQISGFPLLIDCSWNLESDYKLIIHFESELSESQKEILDSIVANNVN